MACSEKQQTGNLQATLHLTRTKVLVPGTAPGLCTGVGRGTVLLCNPRGGPSTGARGVPRQAPAPPTQPLKGSAAKLAQQLLALDPNLFLVRRMHPEATDSHQPANTLGCRSPQSPKQTVSSSASLKRQSRTDELPVRAQLLAESVGQKRKRRRTLKTRPLAEHPGVQLEKNAGQLMHSGMAAIRALMLPGLCHADACKANVTGFLRAHSTAHQGPASDLDALEGHGSCEGALPGLSELKRLQASVLALSASESLHLLGAELLAQVIDVLAGYMRQGQSVVLDLEANATSEYMGGLQHLWGKPHLALWSLRACSICCSSVLCLQEGTQADLILQGLEACSICLRILVAPGMPKQIFREDVIELMLDLTRFQLLHNVLVFHDERIRQANKLSAGQDVITPNKAKDKISKKLKDSVPEAVNRVSSRLEAVLQLLAGLFGAVHVPASASSRLLRAACQALTVQCLPSLHVKAIGILVAVSQSSQDQRTVLIQEVLDAVLPNVAVSKQTARTFLLAARSQKGSSDLEPKAVLDLLLSGNFDRTSQLRALCGIQTP
eukprot:jgi/Astpho2/5418/Aster-07368